MAHLNKVKKQRHWENGLFSPMNKYLVGVIYNLKIWQIFSLESHREFNSKLKADFVATTHLIECRKHKGMAIPNTVGAMGSLITWRREGWKMVQTPKKTVWQLPTKLARLSVFYPTGPLLDIYQSILDIISTQK